MIDVSSVIRATPMLISVKLFPSSRKTRPEENGNGKKEDFARNNVKSIRFNILFETSLRLISSIYKNMLFSRRRRRSVLDQLIYFIIDKYNGKRK